MILQPLHKSLILFKNINYMYNPFYKKHVLQDFVEQIPDLPHFISLLYVFNNIFHIVVNVSYAMNYLNP